jgi:hypothetical protein
VALGLRPFCALGGGEMQTECAPTRRYGGRVSRYPVAIRYHEDQTHHALIERFADRQGISYAEAQRIVNRAGIQSLRLVDA